MAGFERSLGPDDCCTLNAVLVLGNLLSKKNTAKSRQAAEDCYYRAFRGLEKLFGEVHEESLRPLTVYALSKWNRGDSREAVKLYTRAVLISQELYGPNAVKTIMMVCDLSDMCFAAGMSDKLAQYYNWILRGWDSIRQLPADEMDPKDITFLHKISIYAETARAYLASNTVSRALTHLSSDTVGAVVSSGTLGAVEKMISFFDWRV